MMNLAQNLMQMIYRLCHSELHILSLLCNFSSFLSYSSQGQNGGYSILHQGINKKGWWLLQECPACAPYLLCNNWFPHSQNQLPSGRLGLSLCAGPPVTGSTSDRRQVMRIS